MPFADLREFLSELERMGQLVHVSRDIQSGYEIFAIMWELSERQGPAFVAERVAGYDIPVVGNIMGTMDRWALAAGLPLGRSEAEYRDLFAEKMDPRSWAEPRIVTSAPCQEVVKQGNDVDLYQFPILQWHPADGGRYITMPLVITHDERFGRNMGMYRVMLQGKDECSVMTTQAQDIGIHVGRALQQGKESIPCAIAIGADPALIIASATRLPIRADEYAFAGGLRGGEPVDIVRCVTSDLYVPATAEIVLEGDLMIRDTRPEGPFVEWMGYAEEPMVLPTFKVKCITHRKNPLYLTTTVGHERCEQTCIRQIPQMSSFLRECRERITGFRRAHLPISGRQYTAVISIEKRAPGWGKHAIMQAYSVPFVAAAVNNIIVVDDDIDPANLEQVFWAVSTRVDPERDVIIFPPAGVMPLNPAARRREKVFGPTGCTDHAVCSKMGIDATLKKFGEDEGHYRPAPVVGRPPADIWEKVKAAWESYGFKA